MDARTAVLSVIAIKPHSLKDLVNRFLYSPPTIYEAVRTLESTGLVKTKDGLVLIGDGFAARKTAEVHILALIHGIDPEFLMRDSTLSIWNTLSEERRYKEIQEQTGYSHVTVKNVLTFFDKNNLVAFLSRKPIIVIRNHSHTINKILLTLFKEERDEESYHYQGTIPFRESYMEPEKMEKILFNKIEEGISIRNTGFLVKDGSGSISIIESTENALTLEDIFLKKLLTTEGVEDLCIKMLRTGELDFDELISSSIENELASVVGCYLDILNNIESFVSVDLVDRFLEHISKDRKIFLKEEKTYGKIGWEGKYEDKWNLDLYLDIDAIKHGVRSA